MVAFLAFIGVARVPVFVDEADNVLGACLIGRGTFLYQDFFSHHFPMPYYVLAALGEPMSCSVFAGRLVGIVSLTLAGAAFARITHNPAATFALLILALTAPLYSSPDVPRRDAGRGRRDPGPGAAHRPGPACCATR